MLYYQRRIRKNPCLYTMYINNCMALWSGLTIDHRFTLERERKSALTRGWGQEGHPPVEHKAPIKSRSDWSKSAETGSFQGREGVRERIGSVNVGTWKGRGMEVLDILRI